ncbi:MAG: hypothetical protein ACO1QB_18415, partial [Verrucomicrobiales bacterium]
TPFRLIPFAVDRSAGAAPTSADLIVSSNHYFSFPTSRETPPPINPLLSSAKSLGVAARIVHDPVSTDLAFAQLQWLNGANTWGTNYLHLDLAQPQSSLQNNHLITTISSNSAPTVRKSGQSFSGADASWLSVQGKLIWTLADLAVQPIVSGVVEPGSDLEFIDKGNGNRFKAKADKTTGRFLTRVPSGSYTVQFHQKTLDIYLAGAAQKDINFTNYLSFTLSRGKKDGKPVMKVNADGEGKHTFTLLGSNMKNSSPIHSLTFQLDISDSTTWPIEVINPLEPVVAVVFADDQPSNRRELFFWR